MPLQKVIEKNMPLYINEWLSELCAIPSIAAHNSHMTEGAEYVEKLCKLAGAHEVHSYETQNAPIIVAHFGSGEEKLLCYEHYDVQPPDPLDDWDSDPFQPHIMGDTEKFLHGKFIARGAADTKGNLVSRLAALHAYQETHGKLPLQVTLLCEGGEEIGSPDLPSFVEKHPFVVQSDYCIWESGGVSDNGAPQLYFGMKGCLYLTIRFHTMARDCHSQGANVAPSAAWLAVLVASSLVNAETGRVLIPGFYDDVREISEADRQAIAAFGVDERFTMKQLGAKAPIFDYTEKDEIIRHNFHPTCNITGLHSGYGGEGIKTIVPAEGVLSLDFRLVPDQDPEKIVDLFIAHLEMQGFHREQYTIETPLALKPHRTSVDGAFGKAVVDSAKKVYGQEPKLRPLHPASGPMGYLCAPFHIPVTSLGVGHSDSRVHAPNENILLENFYKSTAHMAVLLEELAGSQDKTD